MLFTSIAVHMQPVESYSQIFWGSIHQAEMCSELSSLPLLCASCARLLLVKNVVHVDLGLIESEDVICAQEQLLEN